MNAGEHIRYHNSISYGADFDSEQHSASIRAAFDRLRQSEEWRARYSKLQSERTRKFWKDDDYREARLRLLDQRRAYWTEEARAQQRERQESFWSNHQERREEVSEKSKQYWASVDIERRERQRSIARQLNTRFEINEEVVRTALDETGSIKGAARLLQCDRSVFRRSLRC